MRFGLAVVSLIVALGVIVLGLGMAVAITSSSAGGSESSNHALSSQGLEIPNRAAGTTAATTHRCPTQVGASWSDGHIPTGPPYADRSLEIPAHPMILATYPNPTTEGNVGEYFVLDAPAGTRLEDLTITDGHTTAAFPNETISGPVAVTMDPDVTVETTPLETVELEGHLRLAADGDELALERNGTTLDTVRYERSKTARVWYREPTPGYKNVSNGSDMIAHGRWWPRERSCFPSTVTEPDAATAFVLPDSPEVPLEHIEAAEERILIGGYTFASPDTAEALEEAIDRGVTVELLVEAGPVGGTPMATDSLLSRLESQGATVTAIGGPGSRYRFHHPKYAVIDDSVLVTSENWKPSGLGGASSRGWGVVVEDPELATSLESVFRADTNGWDTTNWSDHRKTATFVDEERAHATFSMEHEPARLHPKQVELLLAPETAEPRLLELIDGATDTLSIKQASIADSDFALLEAAIEAAKRGVEVRILLDDSWYHEDGNQAVITALETAAADDDLPLEGKLVGSSDRHEKIHAKGIVIDGETAIVGSLNWNDNSLRHNREVVLALHGEDVGAYYERVFDDDWTGEGDEDVFPFPLELLFAVGAGVAGAVLLGWHHLRFDPTREEQIEDERIYFIEYAFIVFTRRIETQRRRTGFETPGWRR
ncbi:phospholipase D-like domain-containing protein [Halobacteria archaeon AArc-curdl1]|uniref:Phospholipase D-like domain-containing protein n=1 Tax=Natronosalvus hydrolyticus TaxID=2979988 RepID=A0AAP2Z445_9EURY|nr:phospholipase D-like domain-containing protein [Halobacteria archaeon AArc-curdl1]